MNIFDPQKRQEDNVEQSSFNREDSTGRGNEAYKAFVKDKRVRTTTKPSHDKQTSLYSTSEQNENNTENKRKSYNPNFSHDNRPIGESFGDSSNRGHDDRRSDRPNRNFGDRHYPSSRGNYSDRTPYKREYDENGSQTNGESSGRSYDDRRSDQPNRNFGDRRYPSSRGNYSDRTPYKREHDETGSQTNGESSSRSYGDRRSDQPNRNFGDRQGGYQSRGYGDRQGNSSDRGYGENRRGNSSYTRGGYDNQNSGYKPRFGNSENNDNEAGEKSFRPKNREFGSQDRFGNRNRFNRDGGNRFDNKSRYEKRDFSRNRYDSGTGNEPEYTAENYPKYPAPVIEDNIRLNRYISMSGICSRREADEFITAGRVTVNDNVITELGTKVSQKDVIKFDGNIIENEKKVYILMNKPKGYVTSIDDPHADKTVMDLLKNACKERIYPIGRLDKNSLGVLLFTNDGDMAKKLTHPSYEKKKIYQVTLDKPLTKADMEQIAEGITLEDGEIHADEISYISEKKNEVGIEIHSGRNRIVRRIFDHLGYKVTKLDRVYFAGLTKLKLKRGTWRFLTPQEVSMLKSGSYE